MVLGKSIKFEKVICYYVILSLEYFRRYKVIERM